MGRNASNKILSKPKFVARITLKVSKWLALYTVRMSHKGIQIETELTFFYGQQTNDKSCDPRSSGY